MKDAGWTMLCVVQSKWGWEGYVGSKHSDQRSAVEVAYLKHLLRPILKMAGAALANVLSGSGTSEMNPQSKRGMAVAEAELVKEDWVLSFLDPSGKGTRREREIL